MNKEFDRAFQQEIARILNELYQHPISMGDTKIKRVVVKTEKRFVNYLVEHSLVTDLKTGGGGDWALQLEGYGFEVFEKFNGWDDYRKNVIDKESKIQRAKVLAIRFWWLPIIVSVLSLIVSIFALLK
jgi:hypothetical protein